MRFLSVISVLVTGAFFCSVASEGFNPEKTVPLGLLFLFSLVFMLVAQARHESKQQKTTKPTH